MGLGWDSNSNYFVLLNVVGKKVVGFLVGCFFLDREGEIRIETDRLIFFCLCNQGETRMYWYM